MLCGALKPRRIPTCLPAGRWLKYVTSSSLLSSEGWRSVSNRGWPTKARGGLCRLSSSVRPDQTCRTATCPIRQERLDPEQLTSQSPASIPPPTQILYKGLCPPRDRSHGNCVRRFDLSAVPHGTGRGEDWLSRDLRAQAGSLTAHPCLLGRPPVQTFPAMAVTDQETSARRSGCSRKR